MAAGVFSELEDGRFASNDAAATLRAGAPGRMRDVVLNFGEEMYRSFGELLHTVRTGETGFDSVYGAPLFEYYAANPEVEASAAARMLARTLPVARELAASDVLRGARTLVDVGGGAGTLVAEVLRHHREMAGVLLERPGMLALAEAYLSEQGVADRCELVEGDFFSSVPPGGDVYVLKSVLHDWDDQRSVAILRTCRAAMDEAARLVIVELLLPERMTPSGPAALRRPPRLDHAGPRWWPRAHRGRVQAASRSGEPPPGAHHSAGRRSPPFRGRRCVGPRSTQILGLTGSARGGTMLVMRTPAPRDAHLRRAAGDRGRRTKVVVDADMSFDDAATLAYLAQADRHGSIDLDAVTVSLSGPATRAGA